MNKAPNKANSLKDLEKALGHTFQDASLLRQALTHPSLEGEDNYQRLEFLGDRVLGFVIAGGLYQAFAGENEGKLSRRQAQLVRKETIAEIARAMELEKYINMTATARRAGERARNSILADTLEAIIGAMYLDGGLEAAETFIKAHWKSVLARPAIVKDPKSALQEWAQARGKPLPLYTVVSREGPDHAPRFVIEVSVEGEGVAQAEGASKQDAEIQAAAEFMEKFNKNND